MPRSATTKDSVATHHRRPRTLERRGIAASPDSKSSSPASVATSSRSREHKVASSPSSSSDYLTRPSSHTLTMSPSKVDDKGGATPLRLRHPRHSSGSRRKEDIRPERKASVRKEQYDIDEVGDEDDEDDEDDSDLSDLPSSEEVDASEFDSEEGDDDDDDITEAATADLDQSDSDTEMAIKLRAAGDGESLIGSGGSDDEQEEEEEKYLIADAAKADAFTDAQKRFLQAHQESRRRRISGGDQGGQSSTAGATQASADTNADADIEPDLGLLSPNTMRILGLRNVQGEIFQEQENFHTDSEPSFTDFFASDDGGEDMQDDDDELTSDDDSGLEDEISDLEELVGEPFLAHVGAMAATTQDVPTEAELAAAMEAGEEIARQDIPLLVIEDLDGRLIYARAGDGEAVFGSDGEFEFVESEDEDSDDEGTQRGVDARDPRWAIPGWTGPAGQGDSFEDDGDTTDELPDEEMPFPRLLVGSVDPRGGRTSRRARAMAAHLRRLSPRGAAAGPSTPSNVGDNAVLTPSTATDVSATSALSVPSVPSAEASSSSSPGPPATPASSSKTAMLPPSNNVPRMGSFMPSSSKSIHRAVIDGSSQAASPFTSKISLQRKGLAGRRRPRRRSSTGISMTNKRLRQGSYALNMEDTSEAASSPEETKKSAPLTMDLDDVVEASMLWRSDDSSDDGSGDEVASALSDGGSSMPSRRGRSKTAQSDGISLNSSAFSRWRKIPMGAFREQQQGVLRGEVTPRNSGRQNQSQHFGSNYLLQRTGASGSSLNRNEHSPFRRTGSQGSNLHMVVPMHHGVPGGQQYGSSFMISPVLWPVGDRHRSITARSGEHQQQAAGSSSSIGADMAPPSSAGSRKMTRREKRQRKAQREALRNAARLEKERSRAENMNAGVGSSLNALSASGEASVPALPRTPTMGNEKPLGPFDGLSPATAMPRLRISESSPQPTSKLDQVVNGSTPMPTPSLTAEVGTTAILPSGPQGGQHESQPTSSSHLGATADEGPGTSSSLLSSSIPSMDSFNPGPASSPPVATQPQPLMRRKSSFDFGHSIKTSPLFGGLFAPLNMDPVDERELDLERDVGMSESMGERGDGMEGSGGGEGLRI